VGGKSEKDGASYHFSAEQCLDKSAIRALIFVGISSIGEITWVPSLGVDGRLEAVKTSDCS